MTTPEGAVLLAGQCSGATEQGEAALQRNHGNISRAASEIGVSRPTLHGPLAKYDLQPAEFRRR